MGGEGLNGAFCDAITEFGSTISSGGENFLFVFLFGFLFFFISLFILILLPLFFKFLSNA
uniref:Uncharacterized protein n=1 Tax=Meloidogyne enterolobii TaxID=390850 RepID=A0A6V7Y5L1_MELEN|nr:unnamed protein product [Meloidogyne enterolobii]